MSNAQSVDQSLEGIARKVAALRLESAVHFFVEAHQPLWRLLHTGFLFCQPLASPIFGVHRTDLVEQILGERETAERFLTLLDRCCEERDSAGVP